MKREIISLFYLSAKYCHMLLQTYQTEKKKHQDIQACLLSGSGLLWLLLSNWCWFLVDIMLEQISAITVTTRLIPSHASTRMKSFITAWQSQKTVLTLSQLYIHRGGLLLSVCL